MLFLGADLGTSALTLAAATSRGEIRAAVRTPYRAALEAQGWVEHDRRAWCGG